MKEEYSKSQKNKQEKVEVDYQEKEKFSEELKHYKRKILTLKS